MCTCTYVLYVYGVSDAHFVVFSVIVLIIVLFYAANRSANG